MKTRDPFEVREVTSRRGGPAKEPLSREAIVAAALELLQKEGSERMSLRRVAMALDTGPASLYAYVEDLRELQALVLDRALGAVKLNALPKADWRRRLKALLASYIEVLSRSAGLAQLAMEMIAAGPNALRITESLLSLLEDAGIEPKRAAWGVDLLSLYASAIAAEQSIRRHQPNPLGPIAFAFDRVSPSEHPRIHALRDQLLSGAGEDRFDWAIEVLLSGILQSSAPSNEGEGSKTAPRAPRQR